MATRAQIKAEVELMLDEQDDEPLRMSELEPPGWPSVGCLKNEVNIALPPAAALRGRV